MNTMHKESAQVMRYKWLVILFWPLVVAAIQIFHSYSIQRIRIFTVFHMDLLMHIILISVAIGVIVNLLLQLLSHEISSMRMVITEMLMSGLLLAYILYIEWLQPVIACVLHLMPSYRYRECLEICIF